ncbi:uncharacterized protein MELLADRAFT_73526 [Melampsora larici-populina 98AG31]|uniref:Chromatin modification-related protein EAF7 n=1 Tax=Melampsora larici-populina (strain 98AG31 / pathotype 3-4-7) TaxID=747676 RepID=F4S9A8_MELLP|nr:uncharacterized protein MELLADRAFT_73526 [Melampsora larici-populina 98AG31]EGF98787.1 hypothetical protein MELLADRAFT_73526 [Melampsora larici-populina 98AG31]
MSGPQGVLATTHGETAFFRAVIRYRPRGSHRHFAVIAMCKDLERELNTFVSTEEVWDLLRTSYNLDLLNERDPDVIDDSDPSLTTKDLAGERFYEFQLPIHPTTPSELSFLPFVDQRRLDNNPSPISSPGPLSVKHPRDHIKSLRSGSITNSVNEGDSCLEDAIANEDGMESDLTEQEELDDEDEDDSAPEQTKSRKWRGQRPSIDATNTRTRPIRNRGNRARGRGRKKK